MKRQMKWVAGIVSVALAVSMLTLPQRAHAQAQKLDLTKETTLIQKHELVRDLEANRTQILASLQKASLAKKAQVKSADVVNATSVTYSGTVATSQRQYYTFEVVTGGNVVVNSSATYFALVNLQTGQFVNNGDLIESGFYRLIVRSYGTPYDYQITISGVTFNGTPDTAVPTLSVTSPADSMHLNKGEHDVTITGTTTGATYAQYQLNRSMPVALNTTFNQTIQVSAGYTNIDFTAENNSFNGVSETRQVLSPSVERMAGANRYATSAEVSKRLPIFSDTVVIATGSNFPDALSGGALASWEGAPILLTKSTGLSDEVKQEITRRQATHAIILGATGVVSTAVEGELRALGITQIDRYAGKDRYETSAKIATELLKEQDQFFGGHSNAAFVVTGENYADALAASSPAGVYGMPVLLVKEDQIPSSIQQVIKTYQITDFQILGGYSVVSANVDAQLQSYLGNVVRLMGKDRYETALDVAGEYFTSITHIGPSFTPVVSSLHLACGSNYPDAISQGPLAAEMNSPLILTKTTDLGTSVEDYIVKMHPDAFYISGGTGAISTDVENKLNSYLQ